MALDSAWNMYIFRDGKSVLRGSELLREFARELTHFGDALPRSNSNAFLDLLLRAGELECALADAGSRYAALAATITDALADSLVTGNVLRAKDLARRAALVAPPETVSVSTPEGFAYYALHPLDFADLAKKFETHSRYAAVIGIRSIGTTLSAITQAALRVQGLHVERITLRPEGHPYDRKTVLTSAQLQWIATMRSHRADFFVVDEGPGMSGSSFLSVGEALLSAGVDRARIAFAGTREADPASLTSANARARWPSFKFYCTDPTKHLPKGAHQYVAGGIWRANVFESESDWPASWLQMERLKFLSKDGNTLYRFEGFGRFGADVHDRVIRVAEAGFGPLPHAREEGFGVYRMVRGRTLTATDVNASVIQRLADYCAFRAKAFAAESPEMSSLQNMLRFNVMEEFGIELPAERLTFEVRKPVLADGRMLSHKWIDSDGALLKVDTASHGDDHFFPGPTDIAWDLAGAIVEWELEPDAASYLVERYQVAALDDVKDRLPTYLLAYAIFRMGYCKMATASMRGAEEESRLRRDYLRYRRLALKQLETSTGRSFTLALAAAEANSYAA